MKNNFEAIHDRDGRLVEYKVFDCAGHFIGYAPSLMEGWRMISENNRIRAEHISRPQNRWELEATNAK